MHSSCAHRTLQRITIHNVHKKASIMPQLIETGVRLNAREAPRSCDEAGVVLGAETFRKELLGQMKNQYSVSVQIVAGRDDFAERGSVSRSTLRATDALDLSKRWAGKTLAGHRRHRPALLWLRLRRAALYRGVALCQALGNAGARDRSHALPNTIRRYGRLKICATNLVAAKAVEARARRRQKRRVC